MRRYKQKPKKNQSEAKFPLCPSNRERGDATWPETGSASHNNTGVVSGQYVFLRKQLL